MLPSVTGNQLGLREIQTFEADIVAPHTTPVYASDLPLPERPQDSVPVCPLRLWPDGTSTRKLSSVSPAHSGNLLKS